MPENSLFSFKVDKATLDDVIKALQGIKSGVPRVLVRALNQTATTTRNQAIKLAREDVRLTSAFLKQRIQGPADRPMNKATFSRLESRVTARRRGLRLANFLSGKVPAVGQSKPPPKVKVKPTGSAKPITGGFLMRLRNTSDEGGNPLLGIFVRESGKLEHLYGPSPSQIFSRELEGLSVAMQKVLLERIEKETAAVLRQYGGR